MAKRVVMVLWVIIPILLGMTGVGAEEWDLNSCLVLGLKQNPKIIAAEKAAEASKAGWSSSRRTIIRIWP